MAGGARKTDPFRLSFLCVRPEPVSVKPETHSVSQRTTQQAEKPQTKRVFFGKKSHLRAVKEEVPLPQPSKMLRLWPPPRKNNPWAPTATTTCAGKAPSFLFHSVSQTQSSSRNCLGKAMLIPFLPEGNGCEKSRYPAPPPLSPSVAAAAAAAAAAGSPAFMPTAAALASSCVRVRISSGVASGSAPSGS